MDQLAASLSTFPSFLAYFVGGAILMAGFTLLYVNLTSYREFALIREGNIAAAIALTGALLGFVIPLASVIAHSAHLVDLVVWGIIALVVQLLGFIVARLVFPGLPAAIVKGEISEAVFLAGLSLALGILDAACMAG
jgi:putative membrane protein